MKYTIIYYKSVKFCASQHVARMKRIQTNDLKAYLERHDLDVAYVFEGWPKLEGEK